jgi:MFS family permease
LRGIADGLRYLATTPVLMLSLGIDMIAMVLAMPRALFPEVAAERFGGGSAVGWLFSAIAIGSVLGGLTSGWIGRVRRQGVALVIAVVAWGVAVGLAGLADRLWLMVGLLAVAGAADLVSAVYRQSMLQTYAPDRLRGRLQGVHSVVVVGGPRLGDLRAGATAEVVGPATAWAAGGFAAAALAVLLALASPGLVRYRPPTGDAAERRHTR